MHRLSSIILFFFLPLAIWAQSPHGESFQIDCAACHTPDGWEVQYELVTFQHDSTNFELVGQHNVIDCNMCHTSTVFDEAQTDCASCHLDVHQQTLGQDCARCHNSNAWIVDDVTEIHEQIDFPILGAHLVASCFDCHQTENDRRYDLNGIDCINCHNEDYTATTNPGHQSAGYSTNCIECHRVDAFEWSATGIDHNFFPLESGHEISDCAACHIKENYSDTSPDCVSCHLSDFESTSNPNHTIAGLSTDCASCHTTKPNWKPAEFQEHDQLYFPIYSGEHSGEWDACTECHQTPDNYVAFTCISCHEHNQGDMDEEHADVNGYTYVSSACLACHPMGNTDGVFDHNNTDFPLTGEHIQTDCIACHADGYAGTSTICADCHTPDFTQSENPDHVELNLSMDCVTCHTTTPEWNPAQFPDHNDYYTLNGAHADIGQDCAACHNGDYNNTPNTCAGCHQEDFDQTQNPNHTAAQFNTDCAACHSETEWEPSNFDHDGMHFPIYSGAHEGEWDACTQCHTNENDYAEFSCLECHLSGETLDDHPGVQGYQYTSDACLACHPTGDGENGFNHNETNFPLTGEHLQTDCFDCHTNGFEGTSTICADCHSMDLNSTTNPNHVELNISMDCAICHTTDPDWNPALFDVHNDYYALNGAHVSIANDCVTCHNEDYNNTPNTCVGCHQQDFDQTTDPNHIESQFSIDCIICHTEDAWIPSTLDHDATAFPLTGAHIETDCFSCHSEGYAGTSTICADCHTTDFNQSTNPDHGTLGISMDCAICHTTDPDWNPTLFDVHNDYYALNGAHAAISNDCATCHNGDYNNTPNTCVGCHQQDHDQTTDPNHVTSQFSTDCISCHIEDAWEPSTFNHDATAFPLTGEHLQTDCISCHSNGYTGTPTACSDCHTPDFNESTNPDHLSLGVSMDCATCHTTDPAWSPAQFPVHDDYYALNGAHAAISNDCATCHNGDYNNTPNTCVGCHQQDYDQTTDPNHVTSQFSTDCISCHIEDAWEPSTFDHDATAFPLTGEHLQTDCISCHSNGYTGTPTACSDCHTPDFNESTNPDHLSLGVSTDCANCHTTDPAWNPAQFPVHDDYYALNGAHSAISNDCATCHNGDYNNTPNTCVGCHQQDFDQTTEPNHTAAQFNTDCATCHTEVDWVPATFDHDGMYFPIYSGAHEGEWDACTQCHTNQADYSEISCLECHLSGETLDDHEGVQGYIYESDACLACHPIGDGATGFNHLETNFPLTGVHAQPVCIDCHANGFEGTSTVCADCHLADFNGSTNPNHVTINIPMDCAICHSTTEPEWNPAQFPVHDDYYTLNGAHAAIANDCATCHNGDYNNTPNTCVGCHLDDYNQTTDPNHVTSQFSTDCVSCHTEDAWVPSTFNHDATAFPLTGEHIQTDCISCHTNGYAGTSTICADCHTSDFNQSINPDHGSIGISLDCAICHTTDPEWNPAQFPVHDDYYALNGAHSAISNDCATCHNGDYNNTPNTCVGCHQQDFDQTTEPNHTAAQFNTDCATCHTEVDWVPATFDHDGMYFPIYSGAHEGEWDACTQCHTNQADYSEISCLECHLSGETLDDHEGVQGYIYESDACLACHPIGDGATGFNHLETNFPLTGVHAQPVCIDCHANGFEGTSTVCADCHLADFNGSTNPNHVTINIPMDCATCHSTTEPEWNPAQFPVHDDYYTLNGAHAAIANDCATCHNGDYNNTPNTCVGCHLDDYNQTTDPNHVTSQFSTDCVSCHTEDAWVPSTFNHDATAFPLTGEHIQTDCISCHTNGYAGTSTICADCHTSDFNQSINPDHGSIGISLDCAICHTTDPEWNPAQFPVHDDYYALNGAHSAISNDCATCHNGDYNNTPNTCVGCHQQDFDQTTEPNHTAAQFNTDCATCHTEVDWVPATFDHDGMYFPIYSGAHEGEWDACTQCHTNQADYSEISCLECHLSGETLDDHEGVQGYIYESDACLACHPTGDGATGFNHLETNFPLTGVHAQPVCIDCHANGFEGTSTVCADCHLADFNGSTNPNHVTINIPMDCATCHSSTEPEWNPAQFPVHDDYYALNGAHIPIANDCATCHNGDYNNTPNTCVGCHLDDYNQTTDPNHATSQFSTDCFSCHTEEAWEPSTFNHDATAFPLTGEHLQTDCISCHTNGYAETSSICADCHTPDFNQSTNPDHSSLGISMDCATCHTTDPDWNPAQFAVHDDYYALNGAHAAIANDCATCHNGDYNNTPNTCVGCHQQDFDQTTEPNHTAAQFNTDCATCHTEMDWVPATFDHDGMYFPIYSGDHQGEWDACTQCHTNQADYSEISCLECHLSGETLDDHEGVQGYIYESDACLACHPTGDGATGFNHLETNFPLTGVHAQPVCIDCHANGYEGTSTVCADCHLADFNSSTNPNHVTINIPMDCATCHSSTEPEWNPAQFPVHDDYYALNGAHIPIANDCATCHNGDYNNTPNTCVGCHLDDYNQTTDPNHATSQFSTDCFSCHTEEAWEPSTFNHDATAFPLTGEHLQTDCISCHTNGYAETSSICADCHTPDFNQSTNPDHSSLGISMDCATCHTTDPDWNPAQFAVHDDYYALNGAHAAIANDCATCHNGDYNNTPNTCVGCHQQDFDQTTEPNHTAAQFNTDCATCHTEVDWVPATFDHDGMYFPIYSGDHQGEWDACTQCHTNQADYSEISCLECHLSGETLDDHAGVQGYIYESDACLACHPTGDGATGFNHLETNFPLTGVHAQPVCIDCHANGYEGTSTVCADCHIADFNSSTNPNHVTINIPMDCATCHSSTEPEWNPAQFPVHDDYYALNGAHAAIANDCATCHNGDYNNTPNTCVGCHLDDYNQTTDPNHTTSQFSTDCISCHTEDAWEPSTFDHNATAFPLTGEHLQTDCISCHTNGYAGTSTVCADCHTPDFNQSTNPDHGSLGISMDCATCHTTDPDWNPAQFTVHDDYYTLNGAHTAISNDCATCHNGDYNNTPNSCVGCHLDDYNQTTDPNHASAQFPNDCISCHTEEAWVPSTFDHNATAFPLTGEHIQTDCISCHTNGYAGTSTVCADCHTPDFNQSTNPDHGSLGISMDCATCHTTDPDWNPAQFAVHDDYYTLNGAHTAISNDCATCHNGDYNNTPNSCVGCHLDDYNQTTDPNHASAQFPNDCILCHTENEWEPSTWDHDGMYFPIFSGSHQGNWDQCIECHTDPGDFSAFSCIVCHSQGDTDPDHDEVPDYIFESNACFSCHPTGED